MKMLVTLVVCLSVVMQATRGQTILDIIKSEGLKTLATALEKANLTEIFSQKGSLTLFAPSDEAFAKLPSGALDALLADPQELKDTLSYHAVLGAMTSNLIVNNMHAETLLPKEQIILDFENGVLRINRQIRVTKADVEATNGVVHVIDNVLIPMRTRPVLVVGPSTGGPGLMDLVVKNKLGSVMALAQQSGLFHQLNSEGPYTLLAPNDQAKFASGDMASLGRIVTDPKLVANLLKFHVIPGLIKSSDIKDGQSVQTLNGLNIVFKRNTQGDILVNGAKVLSPDIEAKNGVMHIIDTILEPVNKLNPSEAPSAVTPSTATQGLMDVVAENNLPSLMVMAQQSGMFHQLNSEGPYTLLAPREDNNFGGMDPAKIGEIMSEPQKMAHLLQFHVIPGIVKSSDIIDGQSVTTLNGQDLVFSVSSEGVSVNGVKVLNTDIIAGNGVIHVIDNLLVPKTQGSADNTPGLVPSPLPSILDVLESSGGAFSNLLEVFKRSNMTNLLTRTVPLTLFAPNDEAFSKLSPISFYADHELKNILSYHLLDRAAKSHEFLNVTQSNTLLPGNNISLQLVDSGLKINQKVHVHKSDVEASNGYIHVIDSLLIPRTGNLDANDSDKKSSTIHPAFSSMMNITNEKFGLFDELGPGIGYTLLAPNLEARFAPLDQLTNGKIMSDPRMIYELMKQYVLRFNIQSANIEGDNNYQNIGKKFAEFSRNSQKGLTVNGFNVSFSDERNFNKIIHYIDGFFLPDSFVNPTGLFDVIVENRHHDAGWLFVNSRLSKLINDGGPYTILAPIDDYMSGGINPAMKAEIQCNQSVQENLGKYHVIPGVHMSYDLKNQKTVTTMNGQNISLSNTEAGVTVDSINVLQTDIYARNGIIHLIEDILLPGNEVQKTNLVDTLKAFRFDILASMIEVAGLEEILSGESYIIFAPTDSAFEALFSPEEINSLMVSNRTVLTEILKYHVANFVKDLKFTQDHTFGTLLGADDKLRTNTYRRQYEFGEPVTSFPTIDGEPIRRSIQAFNGVIHVIDGVLLPPTGKVSAVLEDDTDLSTFNSAIKMVGLDALLSSDGNFTVFAPTNEAFKKLPAEKLANFLKDEKELSLLLKSHMLPTVVYKSGHRINIEQTIGLGNLMMNREFIGSGIPATVTNYRVKAAIEQFDLKAANGVVHKIGTVLDRGFFN